MPGYRRGPVGGGKGLAKGLGGIGTRWVNDTFEIWGKRIKSIKLDWGKNPNYSGGESLGYKQFWEIYDETGDEYEAVRGTRAYEQMKKNGFGKIANVDFGDDGFIYVKLEQ